MAAAPPQLWMASVEDVSLLMRTRTVGVDMTPADAGWVGGDTGPQEVTVFDDTTRPTAAEVTEIIELSAAFAQVQVPISADLLPDVQQSALRYVIALYAAVQVEVSFFRETANEKLIDLWNNLAERAMRKLQQGGEDAIGGRFHMTTLRIGTLADELPEVVELDPTDPDPTMPSLDFYGWGHGHGDLMVPGTVPRRTRVRG